MQVLLLLEIFFFLGENKKCFLLSICGTKKNFWIMCLFDQSSLFSVVFLKKSSLNREEALNVELRIFSLKNSALEIAGMTQMEFAGTC